MPSWRSLLRGGGRIVDCACPCGYVHPAEDACTHETAEAVINVWDGRAHLTVRVCTPCRMAALWQTHADAVQDAGPLTGTAEGHWLPLADAAHALGVSGDTVQRRLRLGRVSGRRDDVGGQWEVMVPDEVGQAPGTAESAEVPHLCDPCRTHRADVWRLGLDSVTTGDLEQPAAEVTRSPNPWVVRSASRRLPPLPGQKPDPVDRNQL